MKKTGWLGIFFIIIFLVFSVCLFNYFFIFNFSQSMPIGIYKINRTNDFNRNDIVGICLDDRNKLLGLKRGYISKGLRCKDSEALIKKIIAIPHDTVVLTNLNISVNGYLYNYPTYSMDSQGRRVFSVARGIYINTPGYWVIGTHDAKSWDSRYWGYILQSQILFNLNPVLTLP